jgi:hypothetical protein
MQKTKTMRVDALYSLRNELNFLIKEELKSIFKLELTELAEEIARVLKPIEAVREDLLKKYLAEEMKTGKKAEECEGWESFHAEILPILEQERKITFSPVKREYLDFKTTNYYPQVFKLVEGRYEEQPEPVTEAV